jgi:hypothetical protein
MIMISTTHQKWSGEKMQTKTFSTKAGGRGNELEDNRINVEKKKMEKRLTIAGMLKESMGVGDA